MRSSSRPALLAFAATLAVASSHCRQALAYCRATTCDPSMGSCGKSAHACQTKGVPLQWKDGSIELLVDKAGSQSLGISGADTQQAVEAAFSTWMSADCPGGGHPSFTANTELESGLRADYSEDGPNQSVVLYEDGRWPYETGAVAKTLLAFTLDAGDMVDADVVFNSADFPLATDPTSTSEVDLEAVLTHELGHVLGLAHSDAPGATMQPETQGFATAALKTLEPDDMDGICAIYPPGKKASSHGESSPGGNDGSGATAPASSGCTVANAAATSATPFAAMFAVTLMLLRRRIGRRAPWRGVGENSAERAMERTAMEMPFGKTARRACGEAWNVTIPATYTTSPKANTTAADSGDRTMTAAAPRQYPMNGMTLVTVSWSTPTTTAACSRYVSAVSGPSRRTRRAPYGENASQRRTSATSSVNGGEPLVATRAPSATGLRAPPPLARRWRCGSDVRRR
jgi:hypothetical protein